jgi:FixJ family two-component response regulator
MGVRRDRPIVCIVEDDVSFRSALTSLLCAHGFHVEAYPCAQSFLQKLQAGRLSCAALVLDIHLGTLSGFDVYDRLTTSKHVIPTIFMTGRDDTVTRRRVARVGAVAYLVKPFEDAVLLRAIRGALGSVTDRSS